MGRAATDEAATILTFLRQVTPILCMACLAEITAMPLSNMRATITDLFEAGSLIMAPERSCPLCQTHPAIRVTRAVFSDESMPSLVGLIIVRRDRPETLLNILDAIGRWPSGTAVMLDRRVGERRTQSPQASVEQRRRPRRADPGSMWHTRGFIIVENPRIPHEAIRL